MFDCGEGTQMQMRRMRLSYLNIGTICLSHLHGDHVFGIFGLLSTMALMGRTSHLDIFAPKDFGKVLKFWKTAFGEGMRFEAEHHVLSADAPETVWESRNAELLAFPLNHRVEAYGFILREKEPMPNVRKDVIETYGLTIAEIAALKRGEDVVRPAGIDAEPGPENGFMRFSGGPEPLVISCREATEWVRGVTLLYHEATFPEELSDMASKTYHSTARQAAECARDAGAGRLLIGHYSSRYPDVSVFLKEAQEIFPDTVLANEGDVIEVPLRKFRI